MNSIRLIYKKELYLGHKLEFNKKVIV